MLAYVALREGVIALGNVIDVDPAALSIGKLVRVVFKPGVKQPLVPLFSAS